MTANNEIKISSSNVGIVQSPEFKYPLPSVLTVSDLSNCIDTFCLKVVESTPLSGFTCGEFSTVKALFGSWIESGNEDKQLEELYNSRLNPSSSATK